MIILKASICGRFFYIFTAMKKLFSIFILLLLGNGVSIIACNCNGILPPISYEETERFDLIAVGQIKAVRTASSTENVADVVGYSLYKGVVGEQFQVYFASNTSCLIPFLEQEYWLFYALKDSLNPQKYVVHYCERTRKWVKSNTNDEYIISSGITYMEEIAFLEKNYPKKDFFSEAQIGEIQDKNQRELTADRRLEQASPQQKIIILIVSIIAFALIYIFVRKMK